KWETGDASEGSGGLGGKSARAGFSNGSGAPHTFFKLDGSAVPGALLDGGPSSLATGSLRSATPGRYIFPVIGGAPPSGGSIADGQAIKDLNFELTQVTFAPESFSISPGDERSGFPRTFWDQPLVITENSCPGGTGSFTITLDSTGAGIASGPMVETPPGSGHY